MLLPRFMHASHALFNATNGVPLFGSFAPWPPEHAAAPAWSLAIPAAVTALGPLPGKLVLVVAPTLPGVAWLWSRMSSRSVYLSEHPPAGMDVINRTTCSAVGWMEPGKTSPVEGTAHAVVLLSPLEPPPSRGRLHELVRLMCPGGRIALAFRSGPGSMLDLPDSLRPVIGVPSVLVGGNGHDDQRRASDLRSAFLLSDSDAIGLLVCEPKC